MNMAKQLIRSINKIYEEDEIQMEPTTNTDAEVQTEDEQADEELEDLY